MQESFPAARKEDGRIVIEELEGKEVVDHGRILGRSRSEPGCVEGFCTGCKDAVAGAEDEEQARSWWSRGGREHGYIVASCVPGTYEERWT